MARATLVLLLMLALPAAARTFNVGGGQYHEAGDPGAPLVFLLAHIAAGAHHHVHQPIRAEAQRLAPVASSTRQPGGYDLVATAHRVAVKGNTPNLLLFTHVQVAIVKIQTVGPVEILQQGLPAIALPIAIGVFRQPDDAASRSGRH